MRRRLAPLLTAILAALAVLAPVVPNSVAADTTVDVPTGGVKLTTGLVAGPEGLTAVGDTLFFFADDGTTGLELWKSDGTAAGTTLVKDIFPGSTSSTIGPGGGSRHPVAMDGVLYFVADDGVSELELWKSDGTNAGTVLVADIRPGSGSWGSDPWSLTPVGSTLYFTADTGFGEVLTGRELWKSDGTAAGTTIVKDIAAGPASANIFELGLVGGTLYFGANDQLVGRELWKSDGTEAGTVLVKDIRPGPESSATGYFTDVDGKLFFTADDGLVGTELWKSDGTDAGTVLVTDIRPGVDPSTPQYPEAMGGSLYFQAFEGDGPATGWELWKSDGTAGGTSRVKEITPPFFSDSYPFNMTAFGSSIVFQANDGVHGEELWKSDGSEVGTVMVKDIAAGGPASHSSPSRFTPFDGLVFFTADDGVSGSELWKTDLTTEGTVLAVDINAGAGSVVLNELTVVGDKLFFWADDGGGRQLWLLNRPPSTQSDSYETDEDTPLVVSAPGVLVNDSDPDGDVPLVAQSAGGGQSGTLDVLNDDGSFTFNPSPDFNGTAHFQYTAIDPAGAQSSGAETVDIYVHGINDEPSFMLPASPDRAIDEDSSTFSEAGFASAIIAGPPDEVAAQTLTLWVSNSGNSLFSVQPDIDEVTGTLTFTPAANANGTATVSAYIRDNGLATPAPNDNTSATVTFDITIDPINDEPFFSKGGDITVGDHGPQVVTGWATSISPGPANESGQVLSFALAANDGSLFSSGPTIDVGTGTLTFTPADSANGSTAVTVTLKDNGGTANGGDDTFVDTFTIVVPPPPIAPDTVGVINTANAQWYLRNSAGAVTNFEYGNPVDEPISGNWDGPASATSTPGLFRQSDGFLYARNSNSTGIADYECFAGDPSDVPLAGDWDGDGDDNLGIMRLVNNQPTFYLYTTTCNNAPMGAAQISFEFGDAGDTPVAGDWDGDGRDEIGLYRRSNGFFYNRNTLDTGVAHNACFAGDPSDYPVGGDWDGDGDGNLGIYRPSQQKFFLFTTSCVGTAPPASPFANAMGAAQIEVSLSVPGADVTKLRPVSGAFGLG